MGTNILIPTDGSELAGKAVRHGIGLADRIGAKVTALMVLPPFHLFTTDTQMLEDTPAQHGISAIVLGSETVKVLTHSQLPVLVYR